MEGILLQVIQFILAISLLVLLHEGGHFFFARLFGVWVEKFYLFFDVKIGKWSGSLVHTKKDKVVEGKTTEYGIGWLPLGGYCKIAGMIDESFDTEQMKKPAQPWEFRTKPAWQRLLIMIGGVLVNFLLALFIYSMIMFTWGESYVSLKDMKYGMKFNEEAKALGFKDGDILISADDQPLKDYGADLFRTISTAKRVEVVRNHVTEYINLPGDLNLLGMIKADPRFVAPFIPAKVDTVLAGTPAEKCGLSKGDIILAINGHEVDSHNEFLFEIGRLGDMLNAAETHEDSLKVRTTTVVFSHNATRDTVSVVLTEDLKMGFATKNIFDLYEPTKVEYSFFESFPAGIAYGWHVLTGYVDDLKYVFTTEGAKSLGGFAAIGGLFPTSWNWYQFWYMTAFLSIILAFMNILPIPALDGGHVLFLFYEIITGRKPSETFMIRAEYVGFGIVILLLIVANLNDLLRILGVM